MCDLGEELARKNSRHYENHEFVTSDGLRCVNSPKSKKRATEKKQKSVDDKNIPSSSRAKSFNSIIFTLFHLRFDTTANDRHALTGVNTVRID
jgi:hypothetical protein